MTPRRRIRVLTESLEPIFSLPRYLQEKYFLVFRTAPFVIGILTVKYIVDVVTDGGLIPQVPFLGNIIGASFFLFGFVLSENIRVFRHGEQLPGEIVGHLEYFIDIAYRLKESHQKEGIALIATTANLSKSIRFWLYGRVSTDEMYETTRLFLRHFRDLREQKKLSEKSFDHAISERNDLRRIVVEVDMIRKTTFVSAGYVIGELFSIFIIALLIVTRFATHIEATLIVGVLSFLFIYILLLIQDLDNPFSYSETDKLTSRVNLIQLRKFEKRCEHLMQE